MLIRNDVALLTFVPFTIMLLKMAKREDLFITVIVLQTIGANLGSMLTPIGNPQNLYLYSLYEIPMVKFLLTMLPLTVAAFLLLMFFVFRIKAEDYTIKNLVLPQKPKAHLLLLYLGAFLLCLSCVLHLLSNTRVKGQDYAITKTLDIIKRAVTGMAGVQTASHGKPKGVLFFAGPTGTGKTETAKTLAEKLFGDEKCCIRFDMSEYGQSHSDQKLLGAPPGCVGYEAGGQLTNAVKNNPFSILLFDEIEKAHPSILDKFLQILEDGRMTDGQGNTVYFSESIIIYTSNMGIYQNTPTGERVPVVTSELSYEEVQTKVREGIERYFKLELGRPEILNRIGENIVVYDFIREGVAGEILDSQIKRICNNLKSDKNISLIISDKAHDTLLSNAIGNLDNGGRGIGNIVESLLINPLSRYMFDNELFSDCEIAIDAINTTNMTYSLKCKCLKNK